MRAIMGIDLVEQLRYVVQATENAVLCKIQAEYPEQNYQRINYIYGRASQINAELQLAASARVEGALRYPLIALVEPATIVQPKDGSFPYAVGFGILFIIPSTKQGNSFERQQYVERILYPIYEEFMRQLAKTKSIVSANPKRDLSHSVTVHKANPFYSDTVDVIEVKDLQLKFYPSYTT